MALLFCNMRTSNLILHLSNSDFVVANSWGYLRVMLLVATLYPQLSRGNSALDKEYCSFDNFNATCRGQDEVVLMHSARYGRMRVGKCVGGNVEIRCEKDVLSLLDMRCSGRRACVMAVDDELLRQTKPCSPDYTWNLVASFSCVRALDRDRSVCGSPGAGRDLSLDPLSGHGFMSSQIAHTSGHGGRYCPWHLRAKPGQNFALSVFLFWSTAGSSGLASSGSAPDADVCYELGSVIEGRKTTPVTVCGGNLLLREQEVYVSQSHLLQVFLNQAGSTDNTFLIKYTVTGCATPTPPTGAWGERRGLSYIITCNATQEGSSLVCQDTKWLGSVTNCSQPHDKKNDSSFDLFSGDRILPLGVLVAVALGVALGIFIGGILLAICYSRMKRDNSADPEDRRGSTDYQLDLSQGTKYYTDKYCPDVGRTQDGTTGSTTVSSSGYASYHGDIQGMDTKDPSGEMCKYPSGGNPVGGHPSVGHATRGHGLSCGTVTRGLHTYDSPNAS